MNNVLGTLKKYWKLSAAIGFAGSLLFSGQALPASASDTMIIKATEISVGRPPTARIDAVATRGRLAPDEAMTLLIYSFGRWYVWSTSADKANEQRGNRVVFNIDMSDFGYETILFGTTMACNPTCPRDIIPDEAVAITNVKP